MRTARLPTVSRCIPGAMSTGEGGGENEYSPGHTHPPRGPMCEEGVSTHPPDILNPPRLPPLTHTNIPSTLGHIGHTHPSPGRDLVPEISTPLWAHTSLWKHYLPPTSLAGGNQVYSVNFHFGTTTPMYLHYTISVKKWKYFSLHRSFLHISVTAIGSKLASLTIFVSFSVMTIFSGTQKLHALNLFVKNICCITSKTAPHLLILVLNYLLLSPVIKFTWRHLNWNSTAKFERTRHCKCRRHNSPSKSQRLSCYMWLKNPWWTTAISFWLHFWTYSDSHQIYLCV